MFFTTQAQMELDKLRESVIGIYKHNNLFFLITEFNDKSLNGIRITQFGAIQYFGGMPLRGQYIEFPDGRNMNEMLNKPFDWEKYIKQFI